MTPTSLYCVTNLANGKMYIGETYRGVTVRWKAHVYEALTQNAQTKFGRALRKYGAAGFEVIELFVYPSLYEALEAEASLIDALSTIESGYNTSRGGWSGPLDLETRLKIGAAQIGRRASAETRAKMSTVRTGRSCSEAAKIKIAISHLARDPITYPGRSPGFRQSEATRAKISATKRQRFSDAQALQGAIYV